LEVGAVDNDCLQPLKLHQKLALDCILLKSLKATVVQIAEALKSINPEAAAAFIRLYVGDFLKDEN
jgi:hypothetical protein